MFSSSNFVVVAWFHVKRDGNCVAHHLARIILFGVEQRWECHVSNDIVTYVLMDTLSLLNTCYNTFPFKKYIYIYEVRSELFFPTTLGDMLYL